jgi:hypothetical protein
MNKIKFTKTDQLLKIDFPPVFVKILTLIELFESSQSGNFQ